MKFDKKAQIYTSTPVPNGYGGYTKDIKIFATVDATLTPLHYDIRSVGNVINTMTTCKLFTKTALPDVIDHVIVDGVKFRVQLHNDFGKIHMLSLELDGRLDD